MDKICDGNPSKSEVIGRSGGDEKTKDHAELTVSCKKEETCKLSYMYKSRRLFDQ